MLLDATEDIGYVEESQDPQQVLIMEPINSNSSTALIQPKSTAEKQVRDDSQAQAQNQSQSASEDRFSSSNPVSELQLQRSQVVESLGQTQQAGLNAIQSGETEFPPSDTDISDQQQASATTESVRRQINEQPGNALAAQADQATRQAALTLFQ